MTDETVSRGKKKCPKCSKIVGVRLKTCDCGHEFVAKNKTTSKKTGGSGRKKISADEIKWVLEIKQLVETAQAQAVSVDEFVDGLDLNPAAVLKIETIEELEALKSRVKFSELVTAVGAGEVKRIGGIVAAENV